MLIGTMVNDLNLRSDLLRKIAAYIGCSFQYHDSFPISNERNGVPRYLLTGKGEQKFSFQANDVVVRKKSLICLSAEHGVRVLKDIPAEIGARFRLCQENWTRELSKQTQDRMCELLFREDVERVAELLEICSQMRNTARSLQNP
jgi:hypothetical protein